MVSVSHKRPLPPDSTDSDSDYAGPSDARIPWSDNEDSDNAYKQFKNRKSLNRKRGRKKKRDEAGRSDEDRSRAETALPGSGQVEEELVPSYVRERRMRFEERYRVLQEAGLKLPPTYEEVEFSDDERLGELAEKPKIAHARPVAPYRDIQLPLSLGLIPASVAQWLRDYQVKGVEFLHRLFVYQAGGILGDDMGLGKTVQVIAFLTAAFGKTGDQRDSKRMRKMRRAGARWYPRVLVVCPGTLIENWKDELERWGWWHVAAYHGPEKESALQAAASGRLEILITTYTTYRLNKDMVNSIEWDCVIADECHSFKSQNAETTHAMDEINALCRIGLTGTAIQNSYEELWVLLNWTSPGQLGPLSEWRKTVSEPLRVGQSHEATLHQLGMARKIARALVENLLPRFFLRRMKTLIADQLPKKNDRVVFCPLTDTQVTAYKAFLASDVVDYVRTSSDPCPCESGKKRGWCHYQKVPGGSEWKNYVFPAIANLQKLANHLAILIPQGIDPIEKQEKDLVMLKAALPNSWKELYETRGSITHYSNTEFCGKWKVLKKLLTFWHDGGDKVLIFSHSVRLLRMLRSLFQNTAYNVSYLDGSMSYEERSRAVNDYNADAAQFVFLISTKAGGVGLNITSANKVVIVDPNWNPAWDLQAQDRAYRLGQVRDVEVFRLVSAGTIEEIVYARQIYKQQQANIGYTASTERRYFRGVQHSGANKGEIFGLRNLFGYAAGTQSVLQDIVNQTNVAESRAGVRVVGVELDSAASTQEEPDPLAGESEDSAMANLAEMIKSQSADDPRSESIANGETGPSVLTEHDAAFRQPRPTALKRSDPVQAILAGAGVGYTHENSEVVGSSRVEARLSRRAETLGNSAGLGEQRLFRESQAEGDVQRRPGAFHALIDWDLNGRRLVAEDGLGEENVTQHHFMYHPPEDVRRRHFCSMARALGFESAVKFGLVVEGWTPEQRQEALDRFYVKRRADIRFGGGRTGDARTSGGTSAQRITNWQSSTREYIDLNSDASTASEFEGTSGNTLKKEEVKEDAFNGEPLCVKEEDLAQEPLNVKGKGVVKHEPVEWRGKGVIKEEPVDLDSDASTEAEPTPASKEAKTTTGGDRDIWEL